MKSFKEKLTENPMLTEGPVYCSTYKCNRSAHGLTTTTGRPLCSQCHKAAGEPHAEYPKFKEKSEPKKLEESGQWEVHRNGKPLGIKETNIEFAKKHWAERAQKTGDKFTLHPVKEETEQIDELSKSTLKSYAKQATGSLSRIAHERGFNTAREIALNHPIIAQKSSIFHFDPKADQDVARKRSKRHRGLNTAIDKLTKEETEQIDEHSGKEKRLNFDGSYRAGLKVTVDGKPGEISHIHHSQEHPKYPHSYKVTDTSANDPYKQTRLRGNTFISHHDIKPVNESVEKLDESEQLNESLPYKTGDGKKHQTLDAAKRHAESVHKKTGNVISVEAIHNSKIHESEQIDEISVGLAQRVHDKRNAQGDALVARASRSQYATQKRAITKKAAEKYKKADISFHHIMKNVFHDAPQWKKPMSEAEQIDENNYHVYDNGGESQDRYTVFTHADHEESKRTHKPVEALGMDEHPTHPQGFSQGTSAMVGKHLGKKIPFHSLSKPLQQHIHSRLSEAVEQIDELSKSTLGSYVKKAASSVQKHSAQLGYHGAKKGVDNRAMAAQDKSKVTKRIKGIGKATSRLMKESDMNEQFAPIGDVITLIANQQPSEATTIFNDLMGARVLDAMQGYKKEIAQTLFAPSADSLAEESEQLEEGVTRKHFQQVADIIKAHPDAAKRQELANHHAAIFALQNPRFSHEKFHAAVGTKYK